VATYSFNGMDLRVIEIATASWFVAKDVADALGLRTAAGMASHLKKLATYEKIPRPLNLTPGTRQRLFRGACVLSLVSESGLYKLNMRSDKKEAKQFQDWVTREVLPSIRMTCTNTMPGVKKRPPVYVVVNRNGHARLKDPIIFKLSLSGRSPQYCCMFGFWVLTTSDWTEREQTPCRTA
jgi:prophage antirepressor-like protein